MKTKKDRVKDWNRVALELLGYFFTKENPAPVPGSESWWASAELVHQTAWNSYGKPKRNSRILIGMMAMMSVALACLTESGMFKSDKTWFWVTVVVMAVLGLIYLKTYPRQPDEKLQAIIDYAKTWSKTRNVLISNLAHVAVAEVLRSDPAETVRTVHGLIVSKTAGWHKNSLRQRMTELLYSKANGVVSAESIVKSKIETEKNKAALVSAYEALKSMDLTTLDSPGSAIEMAYRRFTGPYKVKQLSEKKPDKA